MALVSSCHERVMGAGRWPCRLLWADVPLYHPQDLSACCRPITFQQHLCERLWCLENTVEIKKINLGSWVNTTRKEMLGFMN